MQKILKSLKIVFLAAVPALSLIANNASAGVSYWDPTGTTPTLQPSGTWEGAKWASSSTLTSSLSSFTESNLAVFSAGTAATGAFTVTVTSNHLIGGIYNGDLGATSSNLTINGNAGVTLTLTGSTAGFNSSTLLSINATIAGGSMPPLVPIGGGQLFLNGTNTYSGGTWLGYSGELFDGIVNFNNSASLGTGTISVSNTGGYICALVAEGSSAITIPNKVNYLQPNVGANGLNIVGNAAGITFSGVWGLSNTANIGSGGTGNLVIISGPIGGPGGLNKFNPSKLRLSGTNTFAGGITNTNGVLQIGNANAIPNGSGKGNVTLVSASGSTGILDVNGLAATINGLSGNGAIDNSSGAAATLIIGGNNQTSLFSGMISNTGAGLLSIAKTGSGTFTLSPSSSAYLGNTTVSAGILQLGSSSAIPSTSPVIVTTGATLNTAGNSGTFASLSGGGLVTNNTGGITLGGNSQPSNFYAYSCFFGAIDQGQISKNGTHVMSLRSTNLANPNVSVNFNGGVLSLGAAPNCLPTTFGLTVPGGGLFQLDANSQTVSSLSGSGNINLGGGTLTVNASVGGVYSGVIENSELPGSSTAAGHGLRGYYYSNIDFTGLATVRDDANIYFPDFTSATYLPSPPYPKTNYISIRWLGQVLTTAAGNYTFTMRSDDGQRLWVNGTNLVDDWASEGATSKSGSITLAANTRYDIVAEYMNITGGASCELFWMPPGDTVSNTIPTDYLFLPPVGNLVVGGNTEVNISTTSGGTTNTYTGGTMITNGGILEASGDYSLGQGNVYVASTAVLILDSGTLNTYIASNADLVIDPNVQVLNLNYSGTNNIRGLSTNNGASYLPPGTYGSGTSTAMYQLTQASNGGILNVVGVPSTNTLVTSGSLSVYGSPVTFTSTITSSGPMPTGTVTFYDGASAIGMATLSGAQATLTVSDLQAVTSPHSITAVYGGDSVHVGSTSSAVVQTVSPLTLTPADVIVASKVYDSTTTATYTGLSGVLTNDANNVHIASAAVAFASKNIGTNVTVLVSNIVLAGSLSGNYTLSPTNGSTTANITNAVLTVTNLTAVNQVYTGSTNVTLNTSGAGLAGVLGSDNVILNAGGAAGSVATAMVGTNKAVTVTGLTLGGTDAGNYVLTQPTTTVTISQASTTNVVISSPSNPSTPGQSVSFTSTINPIAPGAGTPTGSVLFLTNGTAFYTNTLAAGTTTTTGTTNLPVGTNTITAQYAGDANFIGSTNTYSQVVNSSSPPPGALTITRSGSNVIVNWSGTFTLQSAPVVNGTNSGFADVPGPVQTGPYTNTNSALKTFFRLRN